MKRNWPAEQTRAQFWLEQCRAILAQRSQRTQLALPFSQSAWNGCERRNRASSILRFRRSPL